MTTSDRPLEIKVLDQLHQAAHDTPGLQLLVLHGSRATGRSRPHSDWDFSYLGNDELDPAQLPTLLTSILGTDDVDLVDLARGTALLRFRVARDGALLFEHASGAFTEFQLAATRFWCDAGPIIRAVQEDVLAGLP